MKIKEPRISYDKEIEIEKVLEEQIYEQALFSKQGEEYIEIENITFDSCIFNHIDFTNIKLINVYFVYVIF